jgi:DNA processing protein
MQSFRPDELLGPLNEVERKFAPAMIHVEGSVSLLSSGRRVAIVGSRKASDAGLKRAARLARLLATQGVTVLSGLAEGIDTAAHHSAMQHGGRTIAVLGTPLDQTYPKSNAALQLNIGRDHLLVSQFPVGQPIEKANFVLRNRTMALIANASVIVEAGDGSGTLSQGWEALRLGRPLFLMKSVVENPALTWPNEMLDYGAHILAEPEDLFELLPPERFHEPQDAPF